MDDSPSHVQPAIAAPVPPAGVRSMSKGPSGCDSAPPSARNTSEITPRMSPRRRGELAKEYESKNGMMNMVWYADGGPAYPVESPRPSRKPGLRTFTDPTNPQSRNLSKRVTNMEEVRQEPDRAGARTRNPAIITNVKPPGSAGGGGGGVDGRRTSPHFYSTPEDWRRQKRALGPASASGGSDLNSPTAASSIGSPYGDARRPPPNTFVNYLNDMKKGYSARRMVPSTPSADYQRMNDKRASNFGALPHASPRAISRSASCEPWLRGAEPGSHECHGFVRKGRVEGSWARSNSSDVFQHPLGGHRTVTPRKFERLERQAGGRFETMVAHMRSTLPAQRSLFKECKTVGQEGQLSATLAPGAEMVQ